MCFLVELFFLIIFLHEVPPGFKCQENSPSKLSKEKYNTLYYLGSQLCNCTQQAWIESKISILELSLVYDRNAFFLFPPKRKVAKIAIYLFSRNRYRNKCQSFKLCRQIQTNLDECQVSFKNLEHHFFEQRLYIYVHVGDTICAFAVCSIKPM